MLLPIPEPALVLLVGPSGSGKSTFAAAHFRQTEILSSDAMRASLADDPADQEASADAFRVLALLANGRLKRRRTTIIDATNLRAADRRRYRRLADRYGVPTMAIAFDLPTDAFQARNLARPERLVDQNVVADQARRMRIAMADLPSEAYAALYVLRTAGEVSAATVERS